MKPRFGGKYRLAWIGLIGLVVMAVLLGIVFAVSNSGIGEREVTADFSEVGGMRTGDKVRISGVDVGEVADTTLVPNCVDPALSKGKGPACVRMTMRIDKSVSLTSNASAQVRIATVLGSRFVVLVPGTSPNPLPDNRIPYERTSVPYEIDSGIETMAGAYDPNTGQTSDRVDPEKVGDLLESMNKQLADAPPQFRSTLKNATALSDIVRNRRDQISKLIQDTDTVTDVVSDTQVQLSIIVGQGSVLAQKVTQREKLITGLLDNMASLIGEMRRLGADNNNQLVPLVNNLNTMSEGLEKNRNNLRHTLELLPVVTRQWTNMTGSGNYLNAYLSGGLFPDGWYCMVGIGDGCR